MHTTNFKHDMPSRVDRKLEQNAKAAATWRQVCKVVDFRDKRTCRACGKRTNPDEIGLLRGHRHHIVYRSAGGEDTTQNLLTLCAKCHRDEHMDQMQIRGFSREIGADGPLEFWRRVTKDVGWYLSRRELGVHRIDKD